MYIQTGTDLVHIPRIQKLLDQPDVLERIFTPHELQDMRPEHLAGIFAAKEAFLKATQIKLKHWNQLEVTNDQTGKPHISYPTNLQLHIQSIDISISHENQYALAFVVIILI